MRSGAVGLCREHRNSTEEGKRSSAGGSKVSFRGENTWPGIGGVNFSSLYTIRDFPLYRPLPQWRRDVARIRSPIISSTSPSLFRESLGFVFLLYSQMGIYFYVHFSLLNVSNWFMISPQHRTPVLSPAEDLRCAPWPQMLFEFKSIHPNLYVFILSLK